MVESISGSGTATTGAPATSPRRYTVGVDLGQANDPTAIAVLEKAVVPASTAMFSPARGQLETGDQVFDLVYLKRPKLGTAYDAVAERVADLVVRLEPMGAFGESGRITLCIDGTGVGRAIVDLLRTAFTERGRRGEYVPRLDFRAVTVTGGNSRETPPPRRGGYWSVPKKDLIFPAVAAFQQRRLRIAEGLKDRGALVEELRNYRRVTNIASGNNTFEPWRQGDHDDLLFALSLALWGWERDPVRRSIRARS